MIRLGRILCFLVLCAATPLAEQASAPASATPQQFIYVLRPIPRLRTETNWTDTDSAIAGRHFAHLKALTDKGTVILAGRTTVLDETTFGIVIVEADSLEAARKLMQSDPAVEGGIMTAEVFPYEIVLRRKEP